MMHLALEICQCSHAGSLTADNLQHRCAGCVGAGRAGGKMVIAGSGGGAFNCGAVQIAVCACGGIMALWPIKVKVDIKC